MQYVGKNSEVGGPWKKAVSNAMKPKDLVNNKLQGD